MKITIVFSALLTLASLTGLVHAQEQKILFCADSIKYNEKFGQQYCQLTCEKYTRSACLQKELSDGWVIGSTSPKEVNENQPESGICACVGTQYVLTKPPPKSAEKVPSSATTNRVSLLEKEIQLLKKENRMLQQENNQLQKQVNALESKSPAKNPR